MSQGEASLGRQVVIAVAAALAGAVASALVTHFSWDGSALRTAEKKASDASKTATKLEDLNLVSSMDELKTSMEAFQFEDTTPHARAILAAVLKLRRALGSLCGALDGQWNDFGRIEADREATQNVNDTSELQQIVTGRFMTVDATRNELLSLQGAERTAAPGLPAVSCAIPGYAP